MVKTESCALCFTSKSKWFLDIFCEENQSMEMPTIISKHLWFDLKPSDQCYVCADCWKNVHDFHVFYCKLEKIHFETNDADPKTVQISVQPDFEFHPVDEVKIEPLDDYEPVEKTNDPQVSDLPIKEAEASSSATVRPKRSTSTPIAYKAEVTDSDPEEVDADDMDFLADDGADFDDDDDDEDADFLVDKKEIKKDIVETPKTGKRRGRPPKNSTTKKEPGVELDIDAARASDNGEASKDSVKQKKIKKRRKIKKESDDESSDSDGERRRSGGKRTRDERLFLHVSEFICYLCPNRVEFERFHHANLHYREFHNEPAYLKCAKCDRKCFTPGGFINHMETHDDPDKNKCNICGKVTDQKITLKKHMRAHRIQMEETLPFECIQCPRRFETEKAKDKHERLHGRKIVMKREKGRDDELIAFYKKISCDICDEENSEEGVTYENFWDLKNHMTGEHNKTPYLKCPICFKKNVCRQQLIVHIDVHDNPDRYRCNICGEVCQHLEKHKLKVHESGARTSEKSYTCEHCSKAFRYKVNLIMHIDRVHAVKDVTCDICNKSFTKKSIIEHKRSAHTDLTFMCEQCPKMFKSQSSLRKHLSQHDTTLHKPVKCEICGKELRHGSSLSKHMKVIHSQEDPVNCNMCGKEFRTEFHMIRHRTNTCTATIDSRPFKCEICGKGFAMRLTLTEHMTTHTGTNLYQCEVCLKTFGYSSNLTKHRKKAHPKEWREMRARPD